MQPGVLTALASATIVAPDEAASSPALEAIVRLACAGAWRALEVVLAGDVLRGRLGKTRDTYVRDGVEAVLGLFGSVAVRPEPLAELRAAREAGALDGDLDLERIAARVRTEGAAAVGKTAVERVRRELAAYPQLEAALAEHELGALLVDAARALFRGLARAPELARWAIGPTGAPARDRALVAFAELIGSPASVDELEALIALPIHLDDNVQFTVYRPRSIDPGRWHPMLAFAHLADRRLDEPDAPDPVEEVQRQAASVLGDRARGYQQVTQDAGTAIPAEGELVFVPEIAGIEFNPPRRAFLWLEAVHREEFRMRAGAPLDGKTARGRLTVFLGHIAIAEVPLAVRVDARRAEPAVREPVHARTYRKIFASYSHRDVAIVNQFETYARALGDEYLRDWIHLRTGEVWNDRLRQLIEQADAFQLFWSRNSMHSKFVRQEYEHALALSRPSFVRPTYWEDPMPTAPGLPPEALLRLHFQKIGGPAIAHAEAAPAGDAHPRAPRPGGTLPRPAESSPAPMMPMPAPMARPATPSAPPMVAIPVLAIPDPRRDTARQAAIAIDAESLDAATTAPAMPQIERERPVTAPLDSVTEEVIPAPGAYAPRKEELATAPAVARRPLGVERTAPDDDDDPVIEPPAPAPPPSRFEHADRADKAKREAPMPGAAAHRPPEARAAAAGSNPPPESTPDRADRKARAGNGPRGSTPDRADRERVAARAVGGDASSAPPDRFDRDRTDRDAGDASVAPAGERLHAARARGPTPGYARPSSGGPRSRSVVRGGDDTEPAPKYDAREVAVSESSATLDRLVGAGESVPTLPNFAAVDADAKLVARSAAPPRGPTANPRAHSDTVPAPNTASSPAPMRSPAPAPRAPAPVQHAAPDRRAPAASAVQSHAGGPHAHGDADPRAPTAPRRSMYSDADPRAATERPIPGTAAPSRDTGPPPSSHAAMPDPRAATELADDAPTATEPPKIPSTMPNKAPPPPRPSEPLPMAAGARSSSQPPMHGPSSNRVICDRCGTENTGAGKFCTSCGTVLPTPSVPPMRPSPAPSSELAQLARKQAAADGPAVSPYAPTVPQPQYQGADDPFGAMHARQAAERPAQSGTRWLIVALVVIAAVVAVVVYLMLR